MDRQRDPFWDYVVELGSGKLKCKYCAHEYAKGTSVSRIKWHLSGDDGRGVSMCREVPADVREKAIAALRKRRKTMPSSSNNKGKSIVLISSPKQTNEVESGARGVEMMQTETQTAEQQREAGRIPSVADFGNGFESEAITLSPAELDWTHNIWIAPNIQGENEVRDERLVGPEFHSTEQEIREWREPEESRQMLNEYLMQRECLVQLNETVIPDEHAHKTSGVTLLTTELVGQAFEMKKNEIWSLLMNNEILRIGVYGMGGVGKTALMMHIHNQLLERPNTFKHVYWLTVSQDFSIYKLQNHIANAIGFDLSKEDEEKIRAKKLFDVLNAKKKLVLILDDLWDYFDANVVGIPIGMNGCKMIFTTRSRRICRQMCGCEKNIIKVEPLSKEEAWTLFKRELGDYNIELEPLANAVARECASLPLALKTMARSMRGVDDMSEWRYVLEELKEAEIREDDMEPGVFRVLRYSYDRLKDLTTQECFLYCAFFPEDFEIRRKELIEYLIVEGIIEGKKSRQTQHDKGHVILNMLENACLLDSCIDDEGNRCVKMHDLLRDMALQKLRERSSIMIKAAAQLTEIPDVDEWTDSLVRVSLMKNYIEKIPSGHSPRSLKLSTLLLTSNVMLWSIADSFFEQLHGLKVLDLSNTGIVKLPCSISELVSLVALLLNKCSALRYIPSLAKLIELQKLDLSETALIDLPEAMKCLSNLRYLNLWKSSLKELTTGILPKLFHLQVLVLNKFQNEEIIHVTGKEVTRLRKLLTLECCFESFSDFRECIEHLSLCTCNIRTQQGYLDDEVLSMHDCRLPGTLFGDSRCLMKLKSIYLTNCDGIKSLVSLPWPSSNILKSLETLQLSILNNFRGIISGLPRLQFDGLFSCLKVFQIWHCHGVKRLFPVGLLSTLKNLEILLISFCDRMEEIQAMEEEEDDDDDDVEEEEKRRKGEQNNSSSCNLSVEFILPKLKKLQLTDLPRLKSICSGVMNCDSLQEIKIIECPNLERIPLSYPLPSLQTIQAYPEEWWKSVEWDQLTDKQLLQPILKG